MKQNETTQNTDTNMMRGVVCPSFLHWCRCRSNSSLLVLYQTNIYLFTTSIKHGVASRMAHDALCFLSFSLASFVTDCQSPTSIQDARVEYEDIWLTLTLRLSDSYFTNTNDHIPRVIRSLSRSLRVQVTVPVQIPFPIQIPIQIQIIGLGLWLGLRLRLRFLNPSFSTSPTTRCFLYNHLFPIRINQWHVEFGYLLTRLGDIMEYQRPPKLICRPIR